MQAQLDLGVTVPVVIAGDPKPHTTNAVFIVDALEQMLPRIDESLLRIITQHVRNENLRRSSILAQQTKV